MTDLTDAYIAKVAKRFRFSPSDPIIRENAELARRYHGEPAKGFNGDLRSFWGCDESGRYSARRLFDGYIEQELHQTACDARAARQFERDAYGID